MTKEEILNALDANADQMRELANKIKTAQVKITRLQIMSVKLSEEYLKLKVLSNP